MNRAIVFEISAGLARHSLPTPFAVSEHDLHFTDRASVTEQLHGALERSLHRPSGFYGSSHHLVNRRDTGIAAHVGHGALDLHGSTLEIGRAGLKGVRPAHPSRLGNEDCSAAIRADNPH
jgi:hypothetical protein